MRVGCTKKKVCLVWSGSGVVVARIAFPPVLAEGRRAPAALRLDAWQAPFICFVAKPVPVCGAHQMELARDCDRSSEAKSIDSRLLRTSSIVSMRSSRT